jgi:hypothetical protein
MAIMTVRLLFHPTSLAVSHSVGRRAVNLTMHSDGNRRVLRFFERLWQYDQVVFDASRADASLRDREEETL